LDQLRLSLALEFCEVAMGFEQRFVNEVGPIEAHEQAPVLLQLAGLKQKKRAILCEFPVCAVDHGFQRGKVLSRRGIIDEARAECKHHSPLIPPSSMRRNISSSVIGGIAREMTRFEPSKSCAGTSARLPQLTEPVSNLKWLRGTLRIR